MPFHLRGLSSRIYFAFLIAGAIPVLVAGLVGIHFSIKALRTETVNHLEHEVAGRADAIGRFIEQLTSEVSYLSGSSPLRELADLTVQHSGQLSRDARRRMERDFAAFAQAYPYIYQVRYLDARGQEVVRVDRLKDRLILVAEDDLQNKADRYYFAEAMRLPPGRMYVSPLDLNVERGQVETPERPVIRFATPVADSAGVTRGLFIINIHAELFISQLQQMVDAYGGTAYLFDKEGFYLARSAMAGEAEHFAMRPVKELAARLPGALLGRVLSGKRGTLELDDWIVAHSPVNMSTLAEHQRAALRGWTLAVGYPQQRFFAAVFNLYVLYGVLVVGLAAIAIVGFVLARRMLRPIELLRAETAEIARGNFSHRVEIKGRDEVADLGRSFNAMAERLDASYLALQERGEYLETEVAARTAALEQAQEERRVLDRQMFQREKMTTMGELAMGLAHEIGNPLAGMKAVVQTLLDEEETSPETRKYLARFENEVNRLAAFLRTFHGFAAPQDFSPVPCRLEDVLDDVLLWTRKEARGKGIAIDFHRCDVSSRNSPGRPKNFLAPSGGGSGVLAEPGAVPTPPLLADPNQLKQVLLNLVINAVHVMDKGGRIIIGQCVQECEAGRVRFCVEDDGPGIAPDVLPRIFEPFFTTRSEGSGLGLAVVKKIAEQHGAEILVHSEPGRGTRFEFVWPLAECADPSAACGCATDCMTRLEKPHG